MPEGLAVLKWDDELGPVVTAKTPTGLKVGLDSTTSMRVYGIATLGETEEIAEDVEEELPESEIEAPPEAAAEETTRKADFEEGSEGETDVIEEAEEEIAESALEAQIIAEEPELEVDEASEVEEIGPDADSSALPEEPDDEPDMSEGEPVEEMPQEEISSDSRNLSKKELIDKLLSDTTESMYENDLKKRSKKELQALFDSMNNAEDA